jgi:glycosyltransferase involved in cell wall biosynthesis
MSVYLLISADFITTGGQDRANHALASHLAQAGYEVHLVAHSVDDQLQCYPNVIVHRAPRPLRSALLGERWLERIGQRVARELRSRGARIIVNGGNCTLPDADVNWVHYVHAAYARRTDGALRQLRYRVAHRRYLESERRALRSARVVIANSHRTAHDLHEHLGIERDRIRVIYYGVGWEFRPRASTAIGRPPKVLFIGGLTDHRKGLDVALRAWEILCADPAWDVELHVIGHGAQAEALRRRAVEKGIGDRVRFLGFPKRRPRAAARGRCAGLTHAIRALRPGRARGDLLRHPSIRQRIGRHRRALSVADSLAVASGSQRRGGSRGAPSRVAH